MQPLCRPLKLGAQAPICCNEHLRVRGHRPFRSFQSPTLRRKKNTTLSPTSNKCCSPNVLVIEILPTFEMEHSSNLGNLLLRTQSIVNPFLALPSQGVRLQPSLKGRQSRAFIIPYLSSFDQSHAFASRPWLSTLLIHGVENS